MFIGAVGFEPTTFRVSDGCAHRTALYAIVVVVALAGFEPAFTPGLNRRHMPFCYRASEQDTLAGDRTPQGRATPSRTSLSDLHHRAARL